MLFNLTAYFRYSDGGFEDSVNASVDQRLLEVEGGDEVIKGLSESVKVVLDLKRTRQGEFAINLEHLIVELSELGAVFNNVSTVAKSEIHQLMTEVLISSGS
jgi:hypothetical protein